MPLVLLVVTLLTQAGSPGPSTTRPGADQGYVPAGSPAELSDVGLLARLRHPGVQAVGFSSFDRTGGNDDGFKGTYSRIREEAGDSVLAEIPGPGIVQRIWFTHTSSERPGLLDGKNEHIKVYLDGRAAPALDIPLEQLFSGTHPLFPRPLVSQGSGGFVSYLPIPFRDGCKILVHGRGVRFYQIGLVKLPFGDGVLSFTDRPTEEVRTALERSARVWSEPASYEESELGSCELARYELEGLGHSAHLFALRAGPATVRSIELIPAAGTEDDWRKARLRMAWDSDETDAAEVDLPLGYMFGTLDGTDPYASLLLGQKSGVWYNRFPMPYRRQAILRVDTDRPLKGTFRVRTTPGVARDVGSFRAAYRESIPTLTGEDFGWLKEQGRGHFAGVLLVTEGKAKLPYWLEGDDRFRVDGRLALHGTGTEDYFNCGWYALKGRLDRPATYAVHGFPVYRRRGEGWQAAAYRWHLADPVPFSRSIEAGIEHGGKDDVTADYRAAVFWYSERPGPPKATR
jgi:hypothetical protein